MTASGLAFEFYVFSDIIERLGRNRRRKKISVSDAVRAGQKGPFCAGLKGPIVKNLTTMGLFLEIVVQQIAQLFT